MNTERWKRAQIAEKKYWLSTSKTWSTENAAWYWQQMLSRGFTLDYEFFAGKSVLEVGCGPAGIIFQLHNTKSRVGLEPMDLKDLIIDGKKISIVKKGIGEEMPFENESFDVVLSFNALDHSVNPVKVIQEIQRVLRKDGDFLLWIYVLRNHYQFLQGFLNIMDSPHPYHFTLSQLLRQIEESSFEIKYRKNEKGTGLPNNTIKKAVANLMMDTLWLWSKKGSRLVK
jgi:ubiquinone/menaquinone biosynthesis C-methylase UbiE